MNPETWKLIASIGGVLLTVVTGPIIWAMRAESSKIRAELKLELEKLKGELKGDISGLKTDLKDTETRLNQRIDTRLVHK